MSIIVFIVLMYFVCMGIKKLAGAAKANPEATLWVLGKAKRAFGR